MKLYKGQIYPLLPNTGSGIKLYKGKLYPSVYFKYIITDPPVILIDAYSTDIISNITGKHLCEVDFLSDQDLVEWVARAGGEEHGEGLLVGSGESVTADTIVEFYIEADELTQGDLTYRINVYGKNAGGMWTPYDE